MPITAFFVFSRIEWDVADFPQFYGKRSVCKGQTPGTIFFRQATNCVWFSDFIVCGAEAKTARRTRDPKTPDSGVNHATCSFANASHFAIEP